MSCNRKVSELKFFNKKIWKLNFFYLSSLINFRFKAINQIK